jgi:hypothetical protein
MRDKGGATPYYFSAFQVASAVPGSFKRAKSARLQDDRNGWKPLSVTQLPDHPITQFSEWVAFEEVD